MKRITTLMVFLGVIVFSNAQQRQQVTRDEAINAALTKLSTNGNIQVYINEKLSMMGRVENFAHEFFGHAYLYATTRNATIAGHGTETDSNTDSNSELKKRIIRAQNEATSYNR